MRSYSQQTRQHMLTAIQRIVRAETEALTTAALAWLAPR